jgi:ABC-type branched-subunit amino acid transport system ATPase component
LAIDNLSLQAQRRRITGLIGPNGAGKTTLFNACAGWVAPAAGSIWLNGNDVSACSPSERARRGLARTFQQIELFDDLSVAENVSLGREAALAGRNIIKQLLCSRAEQHAVAQATAEALSRCGLEHLAHEPAWSLSTGQRRLVELARAVAGQFTMLMLDEPSSGLDVRETEHLAGLLTELVDTRDLGIVLVEHDMSLVMRTCSYIYVLDFGVPIFAGTPTEVAASDIVQSAYLGVQL